MFNKQGTNLLNKAKDIMVLGCFRNLISNF